jgi:SAM-dependent methyltransferase
MDRGVQLEIEGRLKRQIEAYHEAAMLFAAVTSGIPDLMKQSGPTTPNALAFELGMQPGPLRRFLRGLVVMRLCDELEDGRFALTPVGESFASDSESSLPEKALVVAGQYWLPWSRLTESLKSGEPSFEDERGAPFFRYLAKEEMAAANAADLMQWFDRVEADTIASIGSGYGGFLVPLLLGRPTLEAVVFDAPAVVEAARPIFKAQGLQNRVAFVAGDILKSIPVNADIYVLKGVLQQHGDAEARKILENCRKAMKPGARLIVYERLMPETAMDDPAAIMLDLHMLAITGGRARTKFEMEAMIAEAGLELVAHARTSQGLAFVDATVR